MGEGYYTIREAAEILGVNPITIRRYIKRGAIKSKQYGCNCLTLIPIEELENSTNEEK